MNAAILSLISPIKTDKFGNALAKLQSLKTDFKRSESTKIEDLWVCLKSYKIGTLEQLSGYCTEAKQKKHGPVANPATQQIIIVRGVVGSDEIDLKERVESGKFKDKDLAKLGGFVEQVDQAIHQWKEKIKKSTNSDILEKVNPLVSREAQRKQGSYNNQKKMMSLKPHGLFGMQNLQNTCFFNSAFQCLNSWQSFTDYYKSQLKVFENHSSALQSNVRLLNQADLQSSDG